MRRDAKVANARVVGQHGVERGQRVARAGPLVEHVGDRGGAGGAAGERLGDGAIEFDGTVAVEQLEQPAGLAAEVLAVSMDMLGEA